jgi:hypothetical protein
MAGMMMVSSVPGPCIGVPLDGALSLGGLGFGLGGVGLGGIGLGLGGPALGGYKPQIYKIVSEEGYNCGCKKKKEKKKKVRKCWCKCGCKKGEEEDDARLRYIPDVAMQLATMLPV